MHFHVLTYIYLCTISTGSQLTVCQESCYVAHVITDRCQSQFTSIKGNRSGAFLDYLYNFNCSSPESYLIPGLPPDTEKCLQADDFCELIIILMCTSVLMHVNLPLSLTLMALFYSLVSK